jgi:hypothetical protein
MARFCRLILAALIVIVIVSVQTQANAGSFLAWKASAGPANGSFTDVTIVGGERIFSGSQPNPSTLSSEAKLFAASGDPGSSPMVITDLGFTANWSVAASIEADGSGGYFAIVQEVVPSQEYRSYILRSSDLGSPVQVIGPAPALNPDVMLSSINKDGSAAGDEAGVIPLTCTADGTSRHISPPAVWSDTRLTSLDSKAELFGGESRRVESVEFVAIIYDNYDTLRLGETVEGIVWDLEGDLAVGSQNGYAVYWRRIHGAYQAHFIEESGVPLQGELLAIDHDGSGIAGGYLNDGRAIVVDINAGSAGSWFDIESQLAVPAGTLNAIVAVDTDEYEVAFAGIGAGFTGWDIVASYKALPPRLPGPGLLVAPALLLAGLFAQRRRFR